MQAGLGGGSSDAAAALRALASLWRVRLTRARARRSAAALGADVPYFLEGGTALGLEPRRPACPAGRSPRAVGRAGRCPLRRQHQGGVRLVGSTGGQVGQVGRRRQGAAGRRADANGSRTICSRSSRAGIRNRAALVAALCERAGASQASLSGSGSAVSACSPARRRPSGPRARSGRGSAADVCHPDPDAARMPETCRQVSPSYKLKVCAT